MDRYIDIKMYRYMDGWIVDLDLFFIVKTKIGEKVLPFNSFCINCIHTHCHTNFVTNIYIYYNFYLQGTILGTLKVASNNLQEIPVKVRIPI